MSALFKAANYSVSACPAGVSGADIGGGERW